MDKFRIEIKRSVEKEFQEIPRYISNLIIDKIDELAENPFPANSIKLSGSQKSYRIRVGDYRIVYEIDKNLQLITILYVRHRRDVYRKL